MAKNLLIVESPAKAKTIEKYLGEDYHVRASFGHIRDLPKEDGAIRIAENFKPIYEVSADKAEVVSALKKEAKKAETVWLATDEDREGEAISWHLAEVLGLDPRVTKRIVFHEITKAAIQKAIQNPRAIDMHLVDAQQARRVLDRLVGFELSPILWKKVKFGLSAGRVQSVAVRLIVEREREIQKHNSTAYFNVSADFKNSEQKAFTANLPKKLPDEAAAQRFLEQCAGAVFQVAKLETKPGKRTPAAPFTTSTLQQEASRKMGYSVAQTMRLAQQLYEAGHITYMRTDSVTLSDLALSEAEKAITSLFGARYHKQRRYTSRIANAQEAHEAIRPTEMGQREIIGDGQQQRLYELIWKRTLASQMADAELEKTTAEIAIGSAKTKEHLPHLVATGEVIRFDGFLKLYLEGKDEEEEDGDTGLLPRLAVGETVGLQAMKAVERFTRPPARYTEASLVKALEERSIGRPSTYAPTISTIQKRNYVVKEDREGTMRSYRVLTLKGEKVTGVTETENTGAEKSKLFPMDLGILVNDFLVENFPNVIDYSFTARVEEEFDEIARGSLNWSKMLGSFYPPFHSQVELTEKSANRASGERLLGTDAESGKPVSARLGKYGPIVQIGAQDDEQKRFASLRADQRLDTITIEQALELFKLPRILGKYEDMPVKADLGRFGPYVAHSGKFYSLPKTLDPRAITLEEAEVVIEAKRKADRERVIKVFPDTDIQILNGRWGPYIQAGDSNVKIPKGSEPLALTLQEVQDLVKNAPEPKGRFARKKVIAKVAQVKKAATQKPDTGTPRKRKVAATATKSKAATKLKPIRKAS